MPRLTSFYWVCLLLGVFACRPVGNDDERRAEQEVAAAPAEAPFIYGIHDHDTNIGPVLDLFEQKGARGFVTATVAIGANPADQGGDDFTAIASRGHTVIVRLNHGYCPQGTLPLPAKYADFARRAANYAKATRGAHIFVIGNETNLAGEWPATGGQAAYVSAQDYARAFRLTYDAIKQVAPQAKVVTQALAPFAGPFPAGSTCGYAHAGNPLNWVQYLRQMLDAVKASGPLDGIALHLNSRGYANADIHSTQRVTAGGQSLSFSFDVYRDWVDLGIPKDLYHLPLYATEANGIYYWKGGHPENPGAKYQAGWVQEVYAEIDRYNRSAAAAGKPVFRAVNLYRWCAWCDGWGIDGAPQKGQILADLADAASRQYRWPSGASTTPTPAPSGPNRALNAAARKASSSFGAAFGPEKALDGTVSVASKWTSDGATRESWLSVDLGAAYEVSEVRLKLAQAAGEQAGFNVRAARLEAGTTLDGPFTAFATVSNAAQAQTTTTTVTGPVTTRFVRLVVTDPGIDSYTRLPELEVYGAPATAPPPPPPPPPAGALLRNGDFSAGLSGWTTWSQRGAPGAAAAGGRVTISGSDFNGGLYQRFATGGAGKRIVLEGAWATDPTVREAQWGEVLVINADRAFSSGQDITTAASDVKLLFKNDTWKSPAGWSGTFAQTAAVANQPSFVAAGDFATLVLKAGSNTTAASGVRFGPVSAKVDGSTSPPPPPPPPPVTMPAFCPTGVINVAALRAQAAAAGKELGLVKIGFHTGPGGNANGLGEWMQCLDAARIPFMVKSVDSAGPILEGAKLRRASGVPHVLVYRKSVGAGWNSDVPEYHLAAVDAARRHWARHKVEFPVELQPYKDIIWVETVNEVDKGRSEWMAEFALEHAQLTMADGFNWAAFGWSSGEPEPYQWEGPKMKQFLALAGQHKTRLAVALHEYSYVQDNLDRMFPWLVGRFQKLFEVCDRHGIARPSVLVTEFGWVYTDIAKSVNQAMQVDLPWAAKLYAEHPQVLGAAIWYLGPGFGSIASKAQPLIKPMTEYSLRTHFMY